MAGSTGTGRPLHFRCSLCRSRCGAAARLGGGYACGVELTGRSRPARIVGAGRVRQSDRAREYRCGSCGHVGWSTHKDLERKENAAARAAEES